MSKVSVSSMMVWEAVAIEKSFEEYASHWVQDFVDAVKEADRQEQLLDEYRQQLVIRQVLEDDEKQLRLSQIP